MMKSEHPIPLSFPVPFADTPSYLFLLKIHCEAVPDFLGPPMQTEWIDGLGMADFWAFEYPCGLKVAFEFLHDADSGRVVADSPEIQHVLRHIPFPSSYCVRMDDRGLESEIKLLLTAFPERQHEMDSLRSYQVWRQGTDGNPFTVGEPTSERDAACWVKHLESLGHHQHYWYSKIT